MAWGKSDEQREAERLQQEAAEREEAARRQALADAEKQQAYLASPLGRAHTAYDRGDGFFQFQLATARLAGAPSGFGSSQNAIEFTDDRAQELTGIEAVGWRLDNVGYAFVHTGSTSTNRMISSGEGTVNEGFVIATYLFRRAG